MWERPLSSQLEQASGVGGEGVAGVGGEGNSVGEKNLPLMEIGKKSWELDEKGEGAIKRGCFLLFFSSYGWEKGKKIKIPIPSQHKSMFAPS